VPLTWINTCLCLYTWCLCICASWYNSYKNSQQDATMYQNLLFHVYMNLNMFRATHRPSSGAQNCTSSLWFCMHERLLEAEVAGHMQQPQCPTTFHVCKSRGCWCSFELLMMGGVSLETCWASYKYGIINFNTLLRLVGYFCTNYVCVLLRSPNVRKDCSANTCGIKLNAYKQMANALLFVIMHISCYEMESCHLLMTRRTNFRTSQWWLRID
jgi:hypothetical protein